MKKISLNILILLSLFTVNTTAQDELRDQFISAKRLFDAEMYFDSITEFKRLLFFDKKNEYAFEANKFIALSYKSGGKLDEAVRFFTLAEIAAASSEDLYEMKLWKIRANILRRTTSQALALLDSLEKKYPDNNFEINYWRGWAYIFSDKWDEAAEKFNLCGDTNLSAFCEEVENEKYSENLARILSVFIPGSGQFYTGNYLSGFISLGWNALWGYLTVNSFVEDRIFDGLAIGNLLWLRFYNGNLQNAVKFAEEKNRIIINGALEKLQENSLIIKP